MGIKRTFNVTATVFDQQVTFTEYANEMQFIWSNLRHREDVRVKEVTLLEALGEETFRYTVTITMLGVDYTGEVIADNVTGAHNQALRTGIRFANVVDATPPDAPLEDPVSPA